MRIPDRALSVGGGRRIAGLALVLAAPLAGCGGGSETCAAAGSGEGILMFNVTGHDDGLVTVDGMSMPVATSAMILASAGPHTITAERVTTLQAGSTALQAFEGTVDKPTACVKAGATEIVNVTYALIPTSGKLWLGASNTPDGATMLGFLSGSVAATGTVPADVVANTGGSDGFTFDKAGNMWVLGGTTADPPLARYPAAAFADGGEKTPDITIDSPSFGSAFPGPKVVAFDPAGNLWVSVVASNKVIKFTPDQIAATGSPTAMVERSGLPAAQGLAFDSAGNLWVAVHDDDAVERIDAGHLAASGLGSDFVISADYTSSGVTSTLRFPIAIAFDATGDLWVNYDGTLAKILAADQTGTGVKMITPPVVITTDVATLPVGIAFDWWGGLWMAHEVNKFARLDATQLAASGAVTPSIVITSADVGSAGWFAMYPAPGDLPLYHRLP